LGEVARTLSLEPDMQIKRKAFVLLVAAATITAVVATNASASEELGKRENLSCTACHDKPGSKLLTDKGKYYELRRTTEGFDDLKATFGKCTACHDTKPGSLELTAKGEQFRAMVADMDGLAEWTKQHHPAAPAEVSPPRP
jgi:cytochrome c2